MKRFGSVPLFAAFVAGHLECAAWSPNSHRSIGPLRGNSVLTSQRPRSSSKATCLHMADDGDFWKQQKALVEEMTGRAEKSLRQEQNEKFASRQTGFTGDTAFFTSLIFCLLWAVSDNPFVSFSYIFGAVCGLAYAYGLAKYVETIGGSVDDTESMQGAGIGSARFAFLILLVVFVGKFRSAGLMEIPSIAGFFTYQLASLSQGLREIDD
jgi:hypothetical protein